MRKNIHANDGYIMSSTFIHSTAEVDPAASVAEGVSLWNWSKICAGAVVGEGTRIGQCVYIDRKVSIGRRCKIQNGVSIYTGVTLENDVFIGPNVTFTNDLYPRSHSVHWEITPTIVRDGASVGANATIRCGVVLGENCMVAAGAVVTKDVPPFGLVVGQPARLVDYVTRSGRPLRFDVSQGEPARALLEELDVSSSS